MPAVVFVIVYCVLLLAIPSQLVVGPLGAPGTPANIWATGSLLWWACATLAGLNPVKGFTPLRIAVGALILTVIASFALSAASGWLAPADIRQATDEFWTLVPGPAAELNEKMTLAASRGLLSFGGWVGIVLLTAEGLRSWRDLELLVRWIVWMSTVVATLGIIQFFTGMNIASFFTIPGLTANADFGSVVGRSVLHRVSSTAVHPIEFGVVMAAFFALALHRTIFDKPSWRSWLPTLVLAAAVPVAVSRSGVIVLGVVLTVLFIGWPSAWRRRALVVLPIALVVLRAALPGVLGTVYSLFKNLLNDPSVAGRTEDYAVVLDLYGDHPWFGRGLFTFVPRYYRILDNQFLMALLELGAIGLTVTLMFFVVGYSSARGARLRVTDPRLRHLSLALSGSLAGIVVSYATFDAWSFPMASGVTFLLIGMAGAAWQISVRDAAAAVPAVAAVGRVEREVHR